MRVKTLLCHTLKMKKKQAPQHLIPSPAATTRCLGHDHAEQAILESLRSGKMPHAWLLSGPKGIGKASFAYRIARFLLSRPDGGTANSLAINPGSPLINRIAHKNFPDLHVLEEPFINEEGKPVKELSVHMVRQIGHFLSLSASESPCRIVLIDSVDDMNASSANALLKLLEEPPPHAYLLLISHSPGKVLPTIRSRCRQLKMHIPPHQDAVEIIHHAAGSLPETEAQQLLHLAADAPGIALMLAEHNGLAFYQELLALLATLPALDMPMVLTFADSVASKDNDIRWQYFTHMLVRFMEMVIKYSVGDVPAHGIIDNERAIMERLAVQMPIATWLELWEKSRDMLEEVNRAHLDRRQAVMMVLQMLQGK
jgi:DNA polymerase-3 subunit delta'